MKRGRWAILTTNDFCFAPKLLLLSTILATNLAVAQAQSLHDPSNAVGKAEVSSDKADAKTPSDGESNTVAEKSEQPTVGIPLASGIMELLRTK